MMFFQRTIRDNAGRSQWLTEERAFSSSWSTDPQMSFRVTDPGDMWHGMFVIESVSWRHNFRQSHLSGDVQSLGLDGVLI